MWAKTAGCLPIVPLKAKSLPWEGKGDCSGKTTLAEKEPSPINELLQAARASWLVEGLMWLIRQWGMPATSRCPAELIAIVRCWSWGKAEADWASISPATETATGADPFLGNRLGVRAPATVTRTPCFWEVSPWASGEERAQRASRVLAPRAAALVLTIA